MIVTYLLAGDIRTWTSND